jgi:hypothetical protein
VKIIGLLGPNYEVEKMKLLYQQNGMKKQDEREEV